MVWPTLGWLKNRTGIYGRYAVDKPMSCMSLRVAVVDRTPWLCSLSAPPPDAITITHRPRYGSSAKIVFCTHDDNTGGSICNNLVNKQVK